MSNLDTIQSNSRVANKNEMARKGILAFEESLKGSPNAVIGDSDMCPLKHTFSDGLYIRQISIPKETFLVGKIHFHQHPVFLMQGEIYIVTEFGNQYFKAPHYFVTPPGIKRAAFAETDTTWITVHLNPTNTQNLEELEKNIIAKNFNEYDVYVKKLSYSSNPVKRLFQKILLNIKI